MNTFLKKGKITVKAGQYSVQGWEFQKIFTSIFQGKTRKTDFSWTIIPTNFSKNWQDVRLLFFFSFHGVQKIENYGNHYFTANFSPARFVY